MNKLNNPFVEKEGYCCFGCQPKNPIGLKLDFYEDGDDIYSEWQPDALYCGYNDILHGGIQATLCDEVASWVVYVKCGCAGVTSRLNMKYRHSVDARLGKVKIRGKIVENRRSQFVVVKVNLFDGSDVLCAEAEAIFRLFTKEVSVEHYGYPEDRQMFYK